MSAPEDPFGMKSLHEEASMNPAVTGAMIAMAATADAVSPTACRWCGHYHGAQCPSVKAIEYHADGAVKRVEFREAPVVLHGATLMSFADLLDQEQLRKYMEAPPNAD